MKQISDEHLISVLSSASREFEHARNVLLRDDEPATAQVEEEKETPREQTDGEARTGVLGAVGSAATSVARLGARQVTGKVHPRHDDWARLSVEDRIEWWVDRFGTGVAALVALPSVGGFVTRTAVSAVLDAVGAAGQVLVVNAVAHEMGGTDEADRVVAAASIVLGRDLEIDAVRRHLSEDLPDEGPGDPESLEAERDQDPEPDDPPGILRRLGSTALLTRRVARQFRAVGDLLDERPQGGLIARTMRNLPAIGMLGGFLAERGGVRQAARAARDAFG